MRLDRMASILRFNPFMMIILLLTGLEGSIFVPFLRLCTY